jgi:hypothetical protein
MAINLDFLKNLVAKNQTQDYPIIPLVQVNEQGELQQDPLAMTQAQLAQKQASTPLTLGDRFFGREMTQDYQTVNPDTNETEMATISNYRPGFLNDLASGYRENATQGFDINNLAPQRKGLATRIGEGLGTLARFYDKPIGRMAVATGLSMLTDEANPLGEGVKAYVGRQQYQTADKVYRNQLKQLGMTDEELNAIKGNVTKDIFEGVTSGMRLGDQRMTYGQLAMLDDEIAREVAANPALANQFVPVNFARDIYGKKRDTAEGAMAKVAAETKKIEEETKQVGKPKVNISIRKGGTNSTVTHVGGENNPTQPTDAGIVRVQAPNGQTGTIPRARLREAIKAGYKVI